MPSGRSTLRALTPGLGLLVVFAVAARAVGAAIPGLSALVVAVVLGVFVANAVGTPAWAEPGLERHGILLETGIVLLGVSLTLDELARTGGTVVLLAAAVVLGSVLVLELVGATLFGFERGPRALLASGASVCGVSAVLAVAGAVDADEASVTYAVGTILLFDAVTLVAFPLVGGFLGLGGKVFGIWAGLSLFSTGPTAAVGFAVSESAGQWATITKLVRNSFIGVLAFAYAVRAAASGSGGTSPAAIWYRFPKFLVGFVAVVLIANLGLLSPATTASLERITDWLFTLAFVGLGFEMDIARVRTAGLRPVGLVGVHLLLVSTLTLLTVQFLF